MGPGLGAPALCSPRARQGRLSCSCLLRDLPATWKGRLLGGPESLALPGSSVMVNGVGWGGGGRRLSPWAGGAGVAPREGLWSALAWAPDPKAGSGFRAGPDLALCLEAGGVLAGRPCF